MRSAFARSSSKVNYKMSKNTDMHTCIHTLAYIHTVHTMTSIKMGLNRSVSSGLSWHEPTAWQGLKDRVNICTIKKSMNRCLNSIMNNIPSKLWVCTCAQVLRLVHTRKLGAHINVPSKNAFAHISYMSFQIQMSSGKVLHKRNFMCTQTLKY